MLNLNSKEKSERKPSIRLGLPRKIWDDGFKKLKEKLSAKLGKETNEKIKASKQE